MSSVIAVTVTLERFGVFAGLPPIPETVTISPTDIGCLLFNKPETVKVNVIISPSLLDPAEIAIPVVSAPTIALPCAYAIQLAVLDPTFNVLYGLSDEVVI